MTGRDRSGFWSLRVQILLWTIAPAMVLVIAYMLAGVGEHRRTMRSMVAERDRGLAQALAAALSAQIGGYTAGLQALAADSSLADPDMAVVRAAVQRAEVGLPDLSIAVVGGAGSALWPPALPGWAAGLAATEPANASRLPLVTTAADGSAVAWVVPVEHGGGRLLAELPLDALSLAQILDVSHLGSSGAAALTDGQRVLYLSPNWPESPCPCTWPGVEQALAGGNGVAFAPGPGPTQQGEDVVAYAAVPEPGWVLLVREPWQPLVAPLLRVDRVTPLILLMAGATSLLTLVFGVNYLVRPLQRLRQAAGRIGSGDFAAAGEPVGGVREIEDLRSTLDGVARQVQHYQSALEQYLAALTGAQEEERARIARELHDETVQSLIATSQRAQMAQRALDRDPALAGQRLAELRTMLTQAIEEVRRLSQALRPLYLEDLGLVPALELLAREAGAALQVAGEARRLPPERELTLYRLVQEALSNARRHAEAEHVWVTVTFTTQAVSVAVRDDGVGFLVPGRLSDLGRSGHFGLMGMYERARRAGADLGVTSAPGHGTEVNATLKL